MKTIAMRRDFSFRAGRTVVVQYRQDCTYRRVPEAAAREILAAGAGMVVQQDDGE